jgi:hypothetical protein
MTKPVIFIKDQHKNFRVVVEAISDWDGFEKLIKFAQKYYAVDVLAQCDGPGTRRWILKSGNHTFELIHDDGYGNYFVASTSKDESLLHEIGKDLEERLKNMDNN